MHAFCFHPMVIFIVHALQITWLTEINFIMDAMKYQCVRFIFLLCNITFCKTYNCTRHQKQECQEDCIWSERNSKCMDCQIGYYGINCSSPCRYPNYGSGCQQECSLCGKETCNSAFGCPTTGTTTSIGTLELHVLDEENQSKGDQRDTIKLDPIIIGIVTSSGFFLVLISFVIVTILNRKRFVRKLRKRVHYIESVIEDLHENGTLPRNQIYTPNNDATYINQNQ
nr:uncharacterized protein LOC117692166 isoform X2 [Crassostrea gigas]